MILTWVFWVCDFSKEQHGSLKMILGSKLECFILWLQQGKTWLPEDDLRIETWVFLVCDFSKEQYGSLKMILGTKHVGAILSVLMWKFYVCALVGIIKVS